MSNAPYQRASLFKETLKAAYASARWLWPWILGTMATMLVLYALQYNSISHSPAMEMVRQCQSKAYEFKQHPELGRQCAAANFAVIPKYFVFLLPMFLIESIFIYGFTVAFLRLAMKTARPEYSFGGYFYWLGKVIWKYTRPCLWLLIPIVGMFFYCRSLVKYALVTPLAVLRRTPELQKSWDMTTGHWWRIFWNQVGLIICIAVPLWILFLLPLIITPKDILSYARSSDMQVISALMMPLYNVAVLGLSVIFSCTTYRVLLQEKKLAESLPQEPDPSFTTTLT